MRRQALLIPGAIALLSAGCVERKLFLHSDPPGAQVYLDGRAVGRTPAEIAFEHYGAREIALEREGYETVRQTIQLKKPWYQYPGLDFLFDVVLPIKVRDHRSFRFALTSIDLEREIPDEEVDAVRRNAQELRGQAGTGSP